MPAQVVDGNDVFAVSDATQEAIALARRSGGPSFIECLTYRWQGHSKSDANRYRTRAEIEQWKTRCPILKLRDELIQNGIMPEDAADQIRDTAYAEIEAALDFAQNSPEPSIAELMNDVYA